MLGLSPMELLVIVGVIVLLFGARRLPELGSGIGQAIGNFKKAYRDSTTLDVSPGSDAAAKKESEEKK